MAIQLVDASDVTGGKGAKKEEKKGGKKIEILDPSKVIGGKKENCGCSVVVSGKPLEIISADKIIVCERVEAGMSNSCALCQGVNKEIFGRCKNKWAD